MSAFPLGLVVKLPESPVGLLAAVRDYGFTSCHLSVYEPAYLTEDAIRILARDAKELGVTLSALWAGYRGRVVWDLIEGPVTTGLVPMDLREERRTIIKRSADLAAALGISEVITHLGFVPEDMNDERYKSLIPVLQDIAAHCAKNGQQFCFETGQETPTTLLRTIEDVDMPNVGVNFDPANLILYGKGNPIDAVPMLAPFIRSVHGKDGFYPKSGRLLGAEMPIGSGQVDFPRFLEALRQNGYSGGIFVECDLPEARRPDAIRTGKARLEAWLRG